MKKLFVSMWRAIFRRRRSVGNLRRHAEHELELAGYRADIKEECPEKWLREGTLALIDVFSAQGHSGSSAPFAVRLFSDLASFKLLSPLTGADEEWNGLSYSDGMKWQNNRCSHVFKRADGTAYDIEGRIFREPNGCCYTSQGSWVPVTFPYTPTTEYVDVPADEPEED